MEGCQVLLAASKAMTAASSSGLPAPVPSAKLKSSALPAGASAARPPPAAPAAAAGAPCSRNAPAQALLEKRSLYGETVMVERFIPGRELTCAVMGEVALGVTEIVPAVGFYDYQAKYAPGGSLHVCPAQIPSEVYRKVQQYALDAHVALGCRGVSRADFRWDDTPGGDGEIILLEVNTQPGMTDVSLVPELAQLAGHSMVDLVTWILNDASVNR